MFGLLATKAIDFSEIFSSFIGFAKSAFANFDYIFDTIDIILLTVVFVLAVKFLKNRKAGALITGIIVCLVIYILATIFGLSGIRYILSWLFQIGALAIVILFQPEIRELLEKMGAGSLKSIRIFGDSSAKNSAILRQALPCAIQ